LTLKQRAERMAGTGLSDDRFDLILGSLQETGLVKEWRAPAHDWPDGRLYYRATRRINGHG
jgi:hypothetical protein